MCKWELNIRKGGIHENTRLSYEIRYYEKGCEKSSSKLLRREQGLLKELALKGTSKPLPKDGKEYLIYSSIACETNEFGLTHLTLAKCVGESIKMILPKKYNSLSYSLSMSRAWDAKNTYEALQNDNLDEGAGTGCSTGEWIQVIFLFSLSLRKISE